jgi:hypothetical protein
MIKDEFGFISGRGISKYWGVSQQPTSVGGPDLWVVKFADPYVEVGKANRYRMLTAKDFNLSEQDAAIIGAYFHSNPMPFCNYPPRVHFRSANNKFNIVVDTRGKHIYKANSLDIPLAPAGPSVLEELRAQQQKQFDEVLAKTVAASEEPVVEVESEFDKGFAAGYALREIIERRLGTKNLKTILKTVEERLKDKNKV